MLKLVFAFLIVISIKAAGQSFSTYTDTLNNFSIDIPAGWEYGIDKNYPGIILIARRVPQSKSDTIRDNFNINTIETPGKTLDKTFADFRKYLLETENFKLMDMGDTVLNGRRFKWLIETHKDDVGGNVQLHNYNFVTIKNNKTYILTMVTFSYFFDTIKPLFDQIASSFILPD